MSMSNINSMGLGSLSQITQLPRNVQSDQGRTIQLGEGNHTVQMQQPPEQGATLAGQTTSTATAIAQARENLGLPPQSVQPRPIDNRQITLQPKFTFDELKTISNGKYNVGEVRLNKMGKLEKINNHVGFYSDQNNVRTSPSENFNIRCQVCSVILARCEANPPAGLDEGQKQNFQQNVVKLLLSDECKTLSLSRDEIHFVLSKLNDLGTGENGGFEAVQNGVKDIRAIKMGGADGKAALGNIVGLTKNGDRLSAKEHDIVCSPSINAVGDRRQVIIAEVRKQSASWFEPTGFSNLGKIMANLNIVHQYVNDPGNENPIKLDGSTLGTNDVRLNEALAKMKGHEAISVCRRDEFESFLQDLSEAHDDDASRLESAQALNVFRSVASFIVEKAERGLDRLKGTHTNPFLTLQDNSRTHLQQSVFYRPVLQLDGTVKNTPTGTNFCAMNSILNGIRANPKANKQKVRALFSENGCKLHCKDNQMVEYSYDAQGMQKTGATGYFEQTLNKHLRVHYGHQYDYMAANVSDMAEILGMKFEDSADQLELFSDVIQLDAFAARLNAQLNGGSVLVLTENRPPEEGGTHNVAVTSVEYQQNGTVKMSIVDDVPNGPRQTYEYERVFTKEQLMNLDILQISVVSIPAQIH